MIRLENNRGFCWKKKGNIWFKGYCFVNNKLKSDKDIFSELSAIRIKEDFATWLSRARGCFSIVIKKNNSIFCAVDIIRTFPLFYSIDTPEILISDNPMPFLMRREN